MSLAADAPALSAVRSVAQGIRSVAAGTQAYT
jgi:hypothetical protein